MSTYGHDDDFNQPEEHMPSCPSITFPIYQGFSDGRNHITPLAFGDFPDFPIAHPNPNALYYQTFPGQSYSTISGGYLVPTYTLNTHGFTQQDAIFANHSQINTDFDPPSWNSAFQPAPQSSNLITADRDPFNCPIISPLAFDDYIPYSSSIDGGQSGTTSPLPGFSSNDDLGGSNGFKNPTTVYATVSELNGSANNSTQSAVTNSAKLPIPTSSITTAPASAHVSPNRLACDQPGCTATFLRAADLSRHKKKHGTPEHPCLVNDCDRKGDKAFYRLDKLYDHQRKKHRMTV